MVIYLLLFLRPRNLGRHCPGTFAGEDNAVKINLHKIRQFSSLVQSGDFQQCLKSCFYSIYLVKLNTT